MSLAKFVLENRRKILDEWDQFAATMPGAEELDQAALRDHAEQILVAIAMDMQKEQSADEQEAKGKGRSAERKTGSGETAAESHGVHRFVEGFNLPEMISEYRALRASVIRLWSATEPTTDPGRLAELTRFNEGIDQAITESAQRFSSKVDRSRELFMGILGHDLRTPLHIVLSSADKLMKQSQTPENQLRLATYIHDAAQSINRLVNDLLDVARTRLGGQLPLDLELTDGVEVCEHVISQYRVLHPHRQLIVESAGKPSGMWDKSRLEQLLGNLLRNAIQYGAADSGITMRVEEDGDRVRFSVHNFGPPIPRDLLAHIFEPLRRGETESKESMGLGLHIACEIARAHRGTLTVESSKERGTKFTACMPKESR